MQKRDVHTADGNIIRQELNPDGTTCIELEFLFANTFWTRLFSVAIFYLAFHERLKRDYVMANHMGTRIVMRQSDFNEEAKEVLIATLLHVKERANALHAAADATLFGQPPGAPVETNQLDQLRDYQVTQLNCPTFLSSLSERLA